MVTRKPRSAASSHSRTSAERVRKAAVTLFARRGFAGTSMRDLAKAAGMSLSGLYHHFPGKSHLLYQIQEDAFARLLEPLSALSPRLQAEVKLERLIHNHITFFAHHITEMKVLSHESDALGGAIGRKMRERRREYHRICLGVVREYLRKHRRHDLDARVCTMILFGMLNWIYTWYDPDRHGDPDQVARYMAAVFINGIARGQVASR